MSDRVYFINPNHWGWKFLGANYLQQESNKMADAQQNFGNPGNYLYTQPNYFQTGLNSQYDSLSKANSAIQIGAGGLGGYNGGGLTPAPLSASATKKVAYGLGPWSFIYLTEAQLEIAAKGIRAAKDAFDRDRQLAEAAKKFEAHAAAKRAEDAAAVKQKQANATRVLEPGERVSYVSTATGLKVFGIVASRKSYESREFYVKGLTSVVWAFWDGLAYATCIERNRVTPDSTRG